MSYEVASFCSALIEKLKVSVYAPDGFWLIHKPCG
jgi:hypothetical protein